ncbi:hypothetical protein M430DRAFT_105359 [Amorphotheca resinae ATCC 22711]|uniref:RING-type E3 ubiquitin transferase n=1 Tax=Amorphotheca resinae ATCC 22711 TaxID=857342 RepID=A0A2T3AWQ3_AMORE|nr:hypothetical protein M430DRAFT_105359 [Amorphotheca resinae ATCC 22711]PSS13098.1 hypothetical protein M430DRAFT_105359 [Amorphotheca resinae ATCC 22711]
MLHQLPSIRFTAHQDPRAPRPSLVFSPLARVLPSGNEVIKVGRYSERDNQPAQIANVPSAAPVGFKSKVVSRRHCEFWYSGGRWFIKDVKSSSGTFLNHIRLSSPGTESKPFPVNDGDIVQLGIDFKGGEEMIFRCVKIKVELNKGWQSAPSSFNVQSHKRLRELNSQGKSPTSSSSQDCSICLGPIAPCQSLFVAPCSHTWHYKCIRVIINGPHWPHFVCPNCRTVADLEAELDDVYADGGWEEVEAADANVGIQASDTPEPANTTRQLRQVSGNRDTNISPQLALEESDQDQMSHSDGDIVEASDDSDIGQRVKDAAEAIDHLNIDEPSFPPSSSTSQFPGVSNATVPPVEIVNKNPVSSLSVGASAHLENPDSRTDRNTIRTPSPNGLPSSMTDVVTSTEGPMTPRNDVGPFVFDGSAGRLSDIRLATVASLDLDTAADTPQQPVPQSSS